MNVNKHKTRQQLLTQVLVRTIQNRIIDVIIQSNKINKGRIKHFANQMHLIKFDTVIIRILSITSRLSYTFIHQSTFKFKLSRHHLYKKINEIL